MENMLIKMARQLNAMDEASLTNLWDTYMQRVQEFDASREWEEAFIVLSLLQAVRAKNQLFNIKWKERQAEQNKKSKPKREDMRPWRRMQPRPELRPEPREDNEDVPASRQATVLPFRPMA